MKKIIPVLLGRGVCLAFLIVTYCRAVEPDTPPPLGEIYEIGGHKMHLCETGNANSGPSVNGLNP